jgi:hypothetical protein
MEILAKHRAEQRAKSQNELPLETVHDCRVLIDRLTD